MDFNVMNNKENLFTSKNKATVKNLISSGEIILYAEWKVSEYVVKFNMIFYTYKKESFCFGILGVFMWGKMGENQIFA